VVYGNPEKLPPKEDVPFNPLSPYALTKVAGEYWVRYYKEQSGLKYTSLRYANVYGPRQNTTGGAGVIAIFATLMNKGETPVIFGDGNIGRDYTNITDVVEANALCLEKGDNETFNIGTGKPTTVNEIFTIVKEITGFAGSAKYEAEKPGEVKTNYLDNSKAKQILGWEPTVDLKNGIAEVVEYFKKK
jgi:UDP-glucose 4-epimerase